MITVRKYQDLHHFDHGWLKGVYHFSFAAYYDPKNMGFGALRVVNDDTFEPQNGFPMHSHKNMEIITFVRQGTVAHKDSYGNIGETKAGEVQVMSAGTGIRHEEHNSSNDPIEAYQIWIVPNKLNVEPAYNQMSFLQNNHTDSLPLLVSGDKNDNVLFINQDARIYGGKIQKSQQITQNIKHQAYILCSFGSFTIDNNHTLHKGDAATITEQQSIKIIANQDTEIIIIDVPK